MSKFFGAVNAGLIERDRLEMEAYAARKAEMADPDPMLFERAKMWVQGELPKLLTHASLFRDSPKGIELVDYDNDIPETYLYMACKEIPELVVVEETEVFYGFQDVPHVVFNYYVTVRYG